MLEAWHNHVHRAGHDLSAMGTYLEKVKMLLDNLPEKNSLHAAQIRGHFDALCGFQSLIFGDAENAQKYIQSACKNIPMHHKRARVLAQIFQAGAYQMTGNLETGLPVYVDELQKSLKVDSAYHAMYLVNLCFIYWLEADLFTMRKNAERSLKIAINTGQNTDGSEYERQPAASDRPAGTIIRLSYIDSQQKFSGFSYSPPGPAARLPG